MQSTFRVQVPRGSLQAQTGPKEFQFHEFYWNVGTEPDPEDLKDDPEMPELVEDEDSDCDSEDDGDSDDEDVSPPQDFLEELYKDFPSLRMESQSSSSRRRSKTQHACAAHPSVTTQVEELSNHRAEVSTRDSETTEPSCIPTIETTAQPGKEREAPTEMRTKAALHDIRKILYPPQKKGPGHVDPQLNIFVRTRLEGMQTMLNFYVNKQSRTYGSWAASSLQAAVSLSRGLRCARLLRKLTRQYIKDRTMLPLNPYGDWNETMLINEDLTNEISIYLLSISNEISGEKLRDFINSDDIMSRHGIDQKSPYGQPNVI